MELTKPVMSWKVPPCMLLIENHSRKADRQYPNDFGCAAGGESSCSDVARPAADDENRATDNEFYSPDDEFAPTVKVSCRDVKGSRMACKGSCA